MFKKRENKKRVIRIVAIVIFIIIIIALYNVYSTIDIDTYQNEYEKNVTKLLQTIEQEKEESKQITDLLEESIDCVVGISRIKDTGSTIFLNDGVNKLGLGSGIIVTENGYILTNEHVSGSKYGKCYVTFESGSVYSADVVWSDSDLDLSIIKINANGLKYVNLGDSDSIRIGEKVYAIGNPIGFEFQKTVTSGIISALNRTIKLEENEQSSYMSNLIQTDATINPGNSGGPLIDLDGNVIGINSVKITSADGIGFAIPINIVKPIIEKFKTDGKFEEASIGIFAYDKDVIAYLNNGIKFDSGIYVTSISSDSPAKYTDLKEGDIITKIDGKGLSKMCDLREYIYQKRPGDEVTLTIMRNKKETDIKIKLTKK